MKTIKDLIQEHPFFHDLSPEQTDLVAGCGSNTHFPAGTVIVKEGEPADYFYIIRQGKVTIEIDGQSRGTLYIQTIEAGEVLGWSWLIPPHHWKFTARATEETVATALDGKCLRKKCEEDPVLGYALLKKFATVLASRLEATRVQLLDVYGK